MDIKIQWTILPDVYTDAKDSPYVTSFAGEMPPD